MDYMTIKEAAELWELSTRRVQTMCIDGRIEGAQKFGSIWIIPKNAARPKDRRLKTGKYVGWRK